MTGALLAVNLLPLRLQWAVEMAQCWICLNEKK